MISSSPVSVISLLVVRRCNQASAEKHTNTGTTKSDYVPPSVLSSAPGISSVSVGMSTLVGTTIRSSSGCGTAVDVVPVEAATVPSSFWLSGSGGCGAFASTGVCMDGEESGCAVGRGPDGPDDDGTGIGRSGYGVFVPGGVCITCCPDKNNIRRTRYSAARFRASCWGVG